MGLSLLVNSVNLAMYRYNMTEFEFSLLESIDFWCLVVFTAEMIIKIMAIGMMGDRNIVV